MRINFFAKILQLKNLTQKFNYLVITGKFRLFSIEKQKGLIKRIQRLKRQLSVFSNHKKVAKVITMASLALALISSSATAQTHQFKTLQTNPFGLGTVQGMEFPKLGDLDSDGDLDLLIGGFDGVLHYIENVGTSTVPSFTSAVTSPFGFSPVSAFIDPTLIDFDGDGDLDIVTAEFGHIGYYENTGTATAPSFATIVTDPSGLSFYNTPNIEFADIDNDGDYDAFLGDFNSGSIHYSENIGTATVPSFATRQTNPFNLTDINTLSLPELSDIDNDGDIDMFVSTYNGDTYFFENIGTATIPSFATVQINPYSINLGISSGINTSIPITLSDLDDDGDDDILGIAFNTNLGFKYLENNSAPMTQDTSVSTMKNTDYVFSTTDFPFIDKDNMAYTSIKIVSVADSGTLTLSGVPVIAGDEIVTADVPNLVYSALVDEVGMPYASFTFQVKDSLLYSTDTGIMVINVEIPLNTTTLFEVEQLIISPNPVSDNLNLRFEFSGVKRQTNLMIFNVNGQIVHNELLDIPTGTFNKNISTRHLASGVYFIKIDTPNKPLIQKFIKK